MAGLYIRELIVRADSHRILISRREARRAMARWALWEIQWPARVRSLLSTFSLL